MDLKIPGFGILKETTDEQEEWNTVQLKVKDLKGSWITVDPQSKEDQYHKMGKTRKK